MTTKIKLKLTSTKRGSILAYSLVILATMLAIAGSLAVVAIIEKKGASGTEFSMQALQTADGGVQIALDKINNELKQANPGTISAVFPTCSNKKVPPLGTDPNVAYYELSFLDKTNTALDCTAEVSTVSSIKSIGTYKNTVRAVQVTVSACIGDMPYKGITYKKVLAKDNRCWLDRNLGVSDIASNDGYFQWGRSYDGHQNKNSSNMSAALATLDADYKVLAPNDIKFLFNNAGNNDWAVTQNDSLWQDVAGKTNPCPTGFRVPTMDEFTKLMAATAENITNTATAFASTLKIPAAGSRKYSDGTMSGDAGTNGYYWTSDVSTVGGKKVSKYLQIGAATASFNDGKRAMGASIRCIQN